MRTVVIGTAGHIDHGKTALLRALTGIDADRLPEERRRGMTIDVGYAHLAFDDGVELDFVDVPGHDRLVGNMLVGAGEIDAALLVVAADDGPRPQTLEHLELLDASAIEVGLAAITKVDLVSAERVAAVAGEVRALLDRTILAGSAILGVSALTGDGVPALIAALRAVRDRVVAAPGTVRGPVRLAIDRSFSVRGRGMVVTGTLRGGSVRPGATLRVEPGGGSARVREVQVHGLPRPGHDGGRTALNLAGVAVGELRRGVVLTAGPGVETSDRWLVALRQPAALRSTVAWPLRPSDHARLHVGTDQVDATIGAAGSTRAGSAATPPPTAILQLARPIAAAIGDRGLLREPSSGDVAGAVLLLDAHPPRGVSRRRASSDRLAALAGAVEQHEPAVAATALLALHGALARDRLDHVEAAMSPSSGTDAAAHGGGGESTSGGLTPALVLAPDIREVLERTLLEAVLAHHVAQPLSPGLALAAARDLLARRLRGLASVERGASAAAQAAVRQVADRLIADGRLVRDADWLRDAGRGPGLPDDLLAAMDRLVTALSVAAPPPLEAAAAASGCPAEGVRALQSSGRIVRAGSDLAWAAPTYHRLAATALELARGGPLSPAALRDATGTSRRYVLAILEDLDRRQILHRTPEGHIPGAKAPRREPAA
jgi:selenocysteine-specific elongation factor